MKKYTLLLILALFQSVFGGIQEFKETILKEDVAYLYKQGMFSADDAPSKTSPGDGKSFFNVSLEITKADPQWVGVVSVLIFHSNYKTDIGVIFNDEKYICCVEQLIASELCVEEGEVVFPRNLLQNDDFFAWEADFKTPDVLNYTMLHEANVSKSGMYYLYIANCPISSLSADVKLDGRITFMNPYGYLNGEYFFYLPFYGIMTFVYIFIGFGWLILSCKHRGQLLRLQHAIAAVIILGVIENATLAFDNLGFNNIGLNYTAAMIVGVIFSTFKKAISRVLVLIVSMGYGVVKPTLGNAKLKVILLGVAYTFFSGGLSIAELVQRTQTFSIPLLLFLVLPVAALDTAFYWWIFLCLLRTISQLQVRRQVIKLSMYKWFLGALAFSGIISGIVTLIQIIVLSVSDTDKSWKAQWLWTAFWHLLYVVILSFIVVLWRPTSNNMRYAYMEMNPDGEEITLHPINALNEVVTQRKTQEDKETPVSASSPKVDPKKANDLTSAFSIDDDDKESGKLE